MGKPFFLPMIARAFMIWALSFGIATTFSKADENPTRPPTATRAKLDGDIQVDYPEVAKQNNWEGRIVVLAWVDGSGGVPPSGETVFWRS